MSRIFCVYSNTLEAFSYGQGINSYESLFHLDGTPISQNQHSPGLVAMNVSSAIAATQPYRLDCVKALWNARIPSGHWRYYDGMLYMLGPLYDSGNFRIWWPPYDTSGAVHTHAADGWFHRWQVRM